MANKAPDQSPDTTAANRADEYRRQQRSAKKRAALEAARQRAAVQKRNRILAISAGAVVVIVVAVVLIVSLGGSSKDKPTASTATPGAPASSAPSSAPSAPAPTASGPAFPGVPAGDDPALKTKPVVKAGTGTVNALKVTTLIKGTGPAVKSGDTITVNYVGVTYADGKEFDSSWDRKQTVPFVIGQGAVIPGWDQGLIGVTTGSRVQLDIPVDLAYGADAAANGAPAGALRFVVDVLGTQAAS